MKKYNKSTICHQAYRFISEFGLTQDAAMRKAWAVSKLQVMMKNGIVQFFYVKKSTGELRQAFGTLDPHRIDYTSKGESRKFKDCVCYYDTEKHGFRTFKTYNLVNVVA